MDLNDTNNPQIVGSFSTHLAQGVSVLERGNKIYAVVADKDKGIKIIIIKDSKGYKNYYYSQEIAKVKS